MIFDDLWGLSSLYIVVYYIKKIINWSDYEKKSILFLEGFCGVCFGGFIKDV